MEFKTQVTTTIEQSQKLLELGIKPETADMGWVKLLEGDGYVMAIAEDYSFIDIPAWSLHRLLMMTTGKSKLILIRCESDLFDVIIKRIERDIKTGYFNKEYLED